MEQLQIENMIKIIGRFADWGYGETNMISKTRYDIIEILDQYEYKSAITSNAVIQDIINKALTELEGKIEKRKEEIISNEKLSKEYNELSKIDVWKDFDVQVNGVATDITLEYNVAIYQKYFSEELKEIELGIGFTNIFIENQEEEELEQ